MEKILNEEFRTFTKVTTDIVAGGNLIWTTYYDKLSFRDHGVVELIRVTEKDNGINVDTETSLLTGVYKRPSVGFYDIDIEFRNGERELFRSYCGQFVDHNTLICQGIMNSKFANGNPYESEIFTRM
ncbi:MAG TPA: hypothetical protein VD927_05045 [Chryseosolibacter sp.]|nr:hypothetical protein [Chryseosolibacter sp.]